MKIFITKNICTATFIYEVLGFAISKGISKAEMLNYVNSAYEEKNKNYLKKCLTNKSISVIL